MCLQRTIKLCMSALTLTPPLRSDTWRHIIHQFPAELNCAGLLRYERVTKYSSLRELAGWAPAQMVTGSNPTRYSTTTVCICQHNMKITTQLGMYLHYPTKMHLTVIHIVIVSLPQNVSMLFAPSSGGRRDFNLKNSDATWYIKWCIKILTCIFWIFKLHYSVMNGFYNFKVAVALQAKHINTFRNAKLKPLKISAATDSTKVCKTITILCNKWRLNF